MSKILAKMNMSSVLESTFMRLIKYLGIDEYSFDESFVKLDFEFIRVASV